MIALLLIFTACAPSTAVTTSPTANAEECPTFKAWVPSRATSFCDPGNYSTQSACVADGKRHAESPSEYVRKMSWTTCKELSRKTCVMPAC